jgi:hypothetical protein
VETAHVSLLTFDFTGALTTGCCGVEHGDIAQHTGKRGGEGESKGDRDIIKAAK